MRYAACALIGVGKNFTEFTESGSITAQLCLEWLITFFINENIDIKAMHFKYKMKLEQDVISPATG